MVSLHGIQSRVGGTIYRAEDFLDSDKVHDVSTGDSVTVVEMRDGTEYFFSADSLRRREAGGNHIPRPFVPQILGTTQKKETTVMANLAIERIDSHNPQSQGGVNSSLADALTTPRLREWAESLPLDDNASLEEVYNEMRKLPDLTGEEKSSLDDFDGYLADNRKSKGGSSSDGSSEFDISSQFNGEAPSGEKPKKTPRKKLDPEEQALLMQEHRREVSELEGERTQEETKFIELLKSYIAPYGYLPVIFPVVANDSRLGARLRNTIPASKRVFAKGVSEELKSTVDQNNIPANLAEASYMIEYFETNPNPIKGVIAYLPRNFEPSVLATISTAPSKAKVEGWSKVEGAAKGVIARWVDKDELLHMMMATSVPAVFVDENSPDKPSLKNLEFFFKRMQDTETNDAWYNIVSRDRGTGKARRGTSAGYVPLNTYVQEKPTAETVQTVSAQMIGGPLFNALNTTGKPMLNKFEELAPEAKAMITGNTRNTFILKDISKPGGVPAIGHTNRKDAPSTVTLIPPKVETYKNATGDEKTKFSKENFASLLTSPATSKFNKQFADHVKTYAEILQLAQKRRSKTSTASITAVKDATRATNDIFRGTLPQIGKKAKK